MDDLISELIATILKEPEHNWREALRDALVRYERQCRLMDEIQVVPKERGKDIGFTAVGIGHSPTDPKRKFTVYQPSHFANHGRRPTRGGKPLTDAEITDTLKQWNDDAAKVVKESKDGSAA